uniref:Secreted protein n=1 Tax=Panstrongylus lignarius TaxID=156445 RepID=A0A224Y4E4_9HEMI
MVQRILFTTFFALLQTVTHVTLVNQNNTYGRNLRQHELDITNKKLTVPPFRNMHLPLSIRLIFIMLRLDHLFQPSEMTSF